MIRFTHDAPFFQLWRDVELLDALAQPQYCTTARYEPLLHLSQGSGQIDLLFEHESQCCVLAGLRLDARNLIVRERSPFIWPAFVAAAVGAERLAALESHVLPWLRSIARGRSMAHETIRRYRSSERFERARRDGLLGAAPLATCIARMAPFFYARRFAAGAEVAVACDDAALAYAMIHDIAAAVVVLADGEPAARASFAYEWYGVRAASSPRAVRPDVVLTDRHPVQTAPVVIDVAPAAAGAGVNVDIPAPVPWDLLFGFDAADAPPIGRFSVVAVEPPLRTPADLPAVRIVGGSAGSIALAVRSDAAATHGADLHDAKQFAARLQAEGFSAQIVSDPAAFAPVNLVHIFGSPYDEHCIAFAERARERATDYVFDLPPLPDDPSTYVQTMLPLVCRSSFDEADFSLYLRAYTERSLTGPLPADAGRAVFDGRRARFAELAAGALAVLAAPEDLALLRAMLPPSVAARLASRSAFSTPEPPAARIGHIVPARPFAFVHGTIGADSNALFAALACERHALPIVIAGPTFDVTYLQLLRLKAPSAIVLADPDPAIVSALYRRAAVWVDPAPHARSAAALLRAVACGAVPVLADESPLVRSAPAGVPLFSLRSFDDCARVVRESLQRTDRAECIARLQAAIETRRDPNAAFAAIMAAYLRAPAAV